MMSLSMQLMVMEAMRLSLVEHEAQQRRGAANRDQSASGAGAGPAPSDAVVPTALPPSVGQSIYPVSEPGPRSRTPTPSATSFSPRFAEAAYECSLSLGIEGTS